MNCIKCGKPSLYLLEGGVGKCCYVAGVKYEPPEFTPKSDAKKLDYNRERMRAIQGVEVGLFVIECKGLYKTQRRWVNKILQSWGAKESAKVDQSRKRAEYAVKQIGRGKVIKLD